MDYNEAATLLEYHFWARDRALDAADRLSHEQYTKDLSNSFPSVRDTLVHIYSAEWVWCSRWLGDSSVRMLDPGGYPDVATLRRAWKENEVRLTGILEEMKERGLDESIEYRTFDGKEWRAPFAHMLAHVVNHASYHRGQVTTMLRQLGAAPPKSMDLIAFHRERSTRQVAGAR